jgi:SAM-dependent methyltransferase
MTSQPGRPAPAPADHRTADAPRQVEQAWRRRLLTEPSESAVRDAYDALHAAMRQRAERARLYETDVTHLDRAFLALLPPTGRVLDIGAGNGRFARAAAAAHRVVAVEISSQAIAVMRAAPGTQNRPGICQASGLHLPFAAGSFDAVVTQDLVEHLHSDQLDPHLAEVRRVLAPGGRYLLHTPSSLRGSTSFGLHLREYRLRELRRVAEAHGFRPRWIVVNFARLGWTGTAPARLWPIVDAWETVWAALGRIGLRRLGGRAYAAAIPDVDLELVKPEDGCASST